MQSTKHNGGIQEQLGEKILALPSNGQLIEIPVPYMYIYLSVTRDFISVSLIRKTFTAWVNQLQPKGR